MKQLLIKNARVVDGSGAPWFRADVAVSDGRIVAIGRDLPQTGATVIDAGGHVVAPGFIDSHSHSDTTVLVNPKSESKIHQGITTEVIGQCGSSVAPLGPNRQIGDSLFADDYESIAPDWMTMGEYMARLERSGSSVNIAPLIGHGLIRRSVVGPDDRKATADELAGMATLIDGAMRDGAFGLTTGLIYPPGSFSDLDELVVLAKAAAAHGGIYMSHIRDEGERLFEAVEEAIAVGERAGLPVQISHHKATGPRNWGKVKQSLAMVEAARARGVDVTCDQYPYIATSTGLSSILPGWVHDGGGVKALERLRDAATRARIAGEVEAEVISRGGWDKVFVASMRPEHLRQYQGHDIAEIAAMMNLLPIDAAIELLLACDLSVGMVRFGMCEEDVAMVMRHWAVMIGTDGSSLAPYGPLSAGVPHPRNYGTFPRVLGKYVRTDRVLTLEEAVRKMTSFPAARFGMADRGLVKHGFVADLVIFDPETVTDRSTFAQPHQYPAGIDYVIVGGEVTVDHNEHTGALAGRVLRRGR